MCAAGPPSLFGNDLWLPPEATAEANEVAELQEDPRGVVFPRGGPHEDDRRRRCCTAERSIGRGSPLPVGELVQRPGHLRRERASLRAQAPGSGAVADCLRHVCITTGVPGQRWGLAPARDRDSRRPFLGRDLNLRRGAPSALHVRRLQHACALPADDAYERHSRPECVVCMSRQAAPLPPAVAQVELTDAGPSAEAPFLPLLGAGPT
jgi:hypothetical protein